MSNDDISVIIAAHPARARSGLLSRALQSVQSQTLLPAAVVVAMDLRGEGAAKTRQRALEAVQTPFVAILDSDDIWLPQHLEKLMGHAKETGADYVYSWFSTLPPGHDPFPPTHFSNDFNPVDPIETTVTVLMRTAIAKQVGYHNLERGEANSGEDFRMLLGCLEVGAIVSHLKERTWIWDIGTQGQNTSGLPTKGDAAR
jgi:glycosyltransferase involved in cell wall biosynthesis